MNEIDWHALRLGVLSRRGSLRGSMEPNRQIGGYLRPHERAEFDTYMEQFKLRKGAVPALLILREIRSGRLSVLKERYPMPGGKGRARVTALPTDDTLKLAFERHAAQFDMDPDPAAGVVYRAELHERWLERALRMESD
jgi:hypothetical protein